MIAFGKFFKLFCCLALIGCSKREPKIAVEKVYNTDFPGRVNDLYVLSDSIILAVGGTRGGQGWVSLTNSADMKFRALKINDKGSMNCIASFRSGIFWLGGERLALYQLNDIFSSTLPQVIWPGNNQPINEEDRTTVRQMLVTGDSMVYFVTGENLGSGLFYSFNRNHNKWNFSQWDSEFRSLLRVNDSTIFAAGHGKTLICNNESSCEAMVCDGIFITSLIHSDNGILACASDGKIYHWNVQQKLFESVFSGYTSILKHVFTKMIRNGDTIVAVGSEGAMVWSDDRGISWQQGRVEGSPDLYSAFLNGNHVYAGADNGQIIKIKMPR
jgi:WD40 repeat protein